MAILSAVERIKTFVVSVPAATTSASPQETQLVFNPAHVVGIELIIPPGHNGFTGIALGQGHKAVLPDAAGDWIIGSGEKIEWPLHGFLNTGNWQAFTYNTSPVPHSFYIRFLLELLTSADLSGDVVVPPLQLA